MGLTCPVFATCVVLTGVATGANAAKLSSPEPFPKVVDARGGQFIGFNHFGTFEKTAGSRARETVLISPVITPRIPWDELIASWNADLPEGTYLKVEARAWHAAGPSAFYVLGLWSPAPKKFPRESVPGQQDENGKVETDTLILKEPGKGLQVRLTLGSETRQRPTLKFLGLSLTDASRKLEPLEANRSAWGITLAVPEKSQMVYPGGSVLCSPTTVSMLLSYWSRTLRRPELEHDVPEVARAVYDTKWEGTGNWAFNMAYAGSFPGMRGYVTRLTDVAELEDWIASGIPVGLSLCYDRLRGKVPKGRGNGHLVVCVGFTDTGDPVINDPGTSQHVRKVFPRRDLVSAWAYSKNAAYLMYPQDAHIPTDRFGHWASWTARQRARQD